MHSIVRLGLMVSLKLYFEASTLPSNSTLFLEWNGVSPLSSSKRMTPMDQTSDLYEYSFFMTTYGAMYSGVPQIVLLICPLCFSFFENPKSAIFISKFVVSKSTSRKNVLF